MNPKFDKLKTLLKELFQLDQPDLDFGLYRIMHAKSAEVTQFLDVDLLPQVKEAFGLYKTADKAELEKELTQAIAQAQSLGADPETLPKVKELRDKLANEAIDIGGLENEVYDHLFSFFRRYYSEGDFLAKRVYRPGVYAIPYEGEEVKLHWANRDQYYIKTSEYLRDYAFRLRPDDAANPMRVHFRLADAVEGEHGNVKAAEGKERVFILAETDFIAVEDDDLVLSFAYRPAALTDWPEGDRDGKKKPPSQKELSAQAVARILAVSDAALEKWIAELAKAHVTIHGETPGYSRLEGHLNRYTKRNTFDYFIHKDLGDFLRRELDFYIKNEVMHLDDIESDTAPRVEQYLSKIKVIRRIAGKVIDFLAQLEDFQKKLWLKKKFVVETQYCITLDRISEEFYPEIAANDAQRDEWVRMFNIDAIQADLTRTAYTSPLSVDFLKQNRSLIIDTALFPDSFKERLIGSIDNIDSISQGNLIHSDNFHALNLITSTYRSRIDCVYIDPPYNSPSSEIAYKNSYKHSSWLTLMHDRLKQSSILSSETGSHVIAIDENEHNGLERLTMETFPSHSITSVAIEHNKKGVQGSYFSYTNEIAIFCVPPLRKSINRTILPESDWEYSNLRNWGGESERSTARNCFYPIYVKKGEIIGFGDVCDETFHPGSSNLKLSDGSVAIYPVDSEGVERKWRYARDTVEAILALLKVDTSRSGDLQVMKAKADSQFKTMWYDPLYNAGDYGTKILTNMGFDKGLFDFPKSINTVKDCVFAVSERDSIVLDYFAGSGTTAHAILNLNADDGGDRKFILTEMGAYFDHVTKPRVLKAAYSPQWTGGRPIHRSGTKGFLFKYLRLESYEDALNNLVPSRTPKQADLLASPVAQGVDGLKEQYLLRYMLDVETRGSPSLLNVQAFAEPTAYKLKVKRPGSDESHEVNVDLLETFNWLVGLTVQSIAAPQVFAADFARDVEGRLVLKGRLRQDAAAPYWFRTVTGATPDGRRTLIIWRKLTGNAEQDNLVLDEWFKRAGYSAKDSEFDLIYVNGDNNLENLKAADDTWKVRLIEEDFHRLMFDTEGL